MSLVKPSISFLPMEDIAGDLVENQKLATQDMLNKYYEGADKKFAYAVNNDTSTVTNALKLNGFPAEDYLTNEDATKIIGTADQMADIYSNEIQNLRDEVYQLKTQLSKNGYVVEDGVYEGFHDSFKRNNKKYETFISNVSESSVSLTDILYLDDKSKIRDFEQGKHFIIYKTDTKEEDIVTVLECDKNGKVKFYPSSNLLFDKDTVELHKTSGVYIRNSFSFSEIASGINAASQERYHMQSDDTMTAARSITKTNTGYAASFKIPYTCVPNDKAALLRFSVIAKSIGNPGNLLCHLIKEEAGFTSGALSPKFTSIEDARDKGLLIATSQPVKAENALTQTTISFDFFNKELNEHPLVEDTRYIFLIECINADVDNYWNIYFSYFKDGANPPSDLEKYNTSLNYKRIIDDGSNVNEKSLNTIDDIDKYDLLFTLAVKDVVDQAEFGKKEGIYTAKIILPKSIDISRARLETRINREGCYYVESYSDDYTTFTLAKEDEYAYSNTDLRFDEGDSIIIGNQFGVVRKSTGNKVTLQNPIYLDHRIEKLYTKNNSSIKVPVYRMNYDISIKPYFVEWDNFDIEKKEFVSTPVTPSVKELELKNIIPTSDNILGSRISDKLLFECDFDKDEHNIAKLANEFELQIKWKSKFEYNEINKSENIQNNFNELIGRIHELVLSFDKQY